MTKQKIVKNKYTRARGGSAELQSIICGKCNETILTYQKDGKGSLVRMYLDRIVTPEELVDVYKDIHTKNDTPSLFCPKCKNLIGVPMIYEKENRLALRVESPIKRKTYKPS